MIDGILVGFRPEYCFILNTLPGKFFIHYMQQTVASGDESTRFRALEEKKGCFSG